MLRSLRFLSASTAARDYVGIGLMLLIFTVAVGTLSILFSPAMRDMALRRFHLGTESFPMWAVHQAVPSMYNFENRVQFTNELLGRDPFNQQREPHSTHTLNHFPARFITFGDRLPDCFSLQRQGTFEMSSTFGDTTLVTRWQIQPEQASNAYASDSRPNQTTFQPMVIQRVSEHWIANEQGHQGATDE